ncbi:MAG: hypothetical protein U5K56_19415 [Halioglobus sp.]|nr:hypothetical protein [Halioglobus sp.]
MKAIDYTSSGVTRLPTMLAKAMGGPFVLQYHGFFRHARPRPRRLFVVVIVHDGNAVLDRQEQLETAFFDSDKVVFLVKASGQLILRVHHQSADGRELPGNDRRVLDGGQQGELPETLPPRGLLNKGVEFLDSAVKISVVLPTQLTRLLCVYIL